MTGDELRRERLRRGLTLAAFGDWLSSALNDANPGASPVKPYARQRVSDWECGRQPIPSKVETLLLRAEVERLSKLVKDEDEKEPRSKQRGRE